MLALRCVFVNMASMDLNWMGAEGHESEEKYHLELEHLVPGSATVEADVTF